MHSLSYFFEGKEEADEACEEREQELLAKRFAKRARMQRLIETHGEQEEFSQLRLIDEDTTIKSDLKAMKVFQQSILSCLECASANFEYCIGWVNKEPATVVLFFISELVWQPERC